MSKPTIPQLTRQQAKAAVEATKPFRKLTESRVPFDAVKRELRGAVITEHADGKGLNVHDPTPDRRHIKRLYEMEAEHRAAEHEIGQAMMLESFPESERHGVRLADGTAAMLPGEAAEGYARKRSLRPVIRWGRPRQRTLVRADGIHVVYRSQPGCALELVRAYRLVDNGDRTSRQVEVPL